MFWVITSLIISFFLMGGCNLSSLKNYLPLSEGANGKDCSYGLENPQRVRVDVSPTKENLYGNRETSEWILVKRDANIPSWKIWGGGNSTGDGYGETVEIGTTIPSSSSQINPDSLGKRVFVGRGHCEGIAGETCTDPLPAALIFVLEKEGAAKDEIVDPTNDRWWWTFNVYYDASLLPQSPNIPSNDDLPPWIKECRDPLEGRTASGLAGTPAVAGVSSTQENGDGFLLAQALMTPPSLIQKSDIIKNSDTSINWETLSNTFWYEKAIALIPETTWAKELGSLQYRETRFSVWLSMDGQDNLILDPNDQSGKYFLYNSIVESSAQSKTLQLGSFKPKGKVVYEWWTPSCKPAIYLYPEKTTNLSVVVKPQGKITVSKPNHGTGWQVTAYPDGTIINDKIIYPYLYYEAEIEKVVVPQDGWIIETKDLPGFFANILPKLGLNQKESHDFLDYWLPKLSEAEKWFVGLINKDELDRVEKIEFSTPPDNFIRVRFYFEKLEKNSIPAKKIYTPEKTLDINFPTPKREGFTAVDWGGIIENGDCGQNETIQ